MDARIFDNVFEAVFVAGLIAGVLLTGIGYVVVRLIGDHVVVH